MLYYKFKNYEEFKELFGITKHGNGVESRKNKILLTYLKNKALLHQATTSGDYELLHISSMSELKQIVLRKIQESGEYSDRLHYRVKLQNRTFYSATYETDNYEGICEDGDKRAVRYVNHDNGGKVFKMKVGKFVRSLILETEFGKTLPEQVVIFLQEELSQEWQSYVMGVLPETTLHIDQDFEKIYSSNECVGDFESCMTDKEYHYFYQYFVDASAAYLTNKEGYIVARTIIFNKVYDAKSDEVWRLAERQYSTDGNNVLHRILVDELIKGGHIDGYKQIGAGCSDSRAFVDNEGNSLSDKTFYIDCNIGYGDTLSYQDSFKWLDIDAQRAYNKNIGYNSIALDTTDGEIEGEDESEYDSYHDEYVSEVYTVYVDGQEETCDSSRLGDFKHINGEWYHENDIETCAKCGNDYVSDDGYYSELTEEHYCDNECYTDGEADYKDANWYWSEFDEEWFEDAASVVKYMRWSRYLNAYEENTISVDSLNEKVDAGEFYLIDDTYYNDIDTETMLPFNHAA